MRLRAFPEMKKAGVLLVFLALGVILTSTHIAFAQESTPNNPVGYTAADNPHGSLMMTGWIAGMAIVGGMSGVGVYTALKRM